MILGQRERYDQRVEREFRRGVRKVINLTFLMPLSFRLGRKGLNKVYQQFVYLIDALRARDKGVPNWERDIFKACSGHFTKQFGLPCKHYMLRKMDSGIRLAREDCDPFWWLDDRTVCQQHAPFLTKLLTT